MHGRFPRDFAHAAWLLWPHAARSEVKSLRSCLKHHPEHKFNTLDASSVDQSTKRVGFKAASLKFAYRSSAIKQQSTPASHIAAAAPRSKESHNSQVLWWRDAVPLDTIERPASAAEHMTRVCLLWGHLGLVNSSRHTTSLSHATIAASRVACPRDRHNRHRQAELSCDEKMGRIKFGE